MIQTRAGAGETIGTMVRMPRTLRDELKETAARLGRSLNTHIVMRLSEATEAAAGGEFGDQAPAAGDENAARQGGVL